MSRTLSRALRHAPDALDLTLDGRGFASVERVLAGLARRGLLVARAELETIVRESDKKRFAFSDDGACIRAVQGHSVDVELGYEESEPPATLFHGTVARFVDAIAREGLVRGQRHHVHLSADEHTARAVGARRGEPIVLQVDARAMRADGLVFLRAENGVWLTAHVPPQYLRGLPGPG